jgi:hypothetical protein
MQLKVYVYSAFKVGVGHLPNKNFEISDSRVRVRVRVTQLYPPARAVEL